MSTYVKRTALWLVLVAAYWVVFAGLPGFGAADDRVDPLAGRPRAMEKAIAEGRFADALPIAAELQRVYPTDALTSFWLAAIYQGLDRPADEAAAWEQFITLTTSRDAACPAVADAYFRAGRVDHALHALERCIEFDRREPERHVDLALGLERAGKSHDAHAVWRRLAEMDPKNPAVASRAAGVHHQGGEGP